MNMLPILILGVVLIAGLAWGFLERRRANGLAERLSESNAWLAEARERARSLEAQGTTVAEILKAQAAQSANAVAEELLKRNAETFSAQDKLSQARLEASIRAAS